MTGRQRQPRTHYLRFSSIYVTLSYLKFRNHFKEVAHDELDPVRHPVHGGVVTGELDLGGVNVNGDHSLTGKGELDCVSSNSTETINNDITPCCGDFIVK